MDILAALATQHKPEKHDTARITLSDGLLSISDAVFMVSLYRAGYMDIDSCLTDVKLEDRDEFLRSIEND